MQRGILKAFTDNADLSDISDNKNIPLKLGDVIQKAKIKVTGKGLTDTEVTPGNYKID